MNSQLFSSSPCFSLLCFLLVILLKIQSSLSNPYLESLSCLTKFECGNITADYPFWGRHRQEHCGHPEFELDCELDDVTTMMISDVKYMVLSINSTSQTLRIAISMLQSFHKVCLDFPNSTSNTTFNSELFNYSGAYENVTLHYGCQAPSSFDDPKEGCQVNGVKYKGESIPAEGPKHGPGGCQPNATVPVPKPLPGAKANWADWEEALKQGFELKWKIEGVVCEKCTNSKGICWFNSTFSETRCYCPHTTQLFINEPCPYKPPQAPPGRGSFFNKRWKISVGIAAAVAGIIIIITILLIGTSQRKHTLDKFVVFQNKKAKNDRIVEAFVRNFGSFAPKKYNYSDVKRMTRSFSNKLGQGGYGDVYKGMLPDGRLVAVKFLKESKGNGEEFINEVASISKTSHVNVVTLLGFCYERKKQALIYEFMPNGSLDKFIYVEEPSNTNHNLEWKTMYQIAIGIARGLEYLHRGCNTRIVHFDIKPHNILLDEDFCPKISDFGLAKLCKKKESTLSMLGARGTIGYIAPEVCSRSFGEVSHKSDVYSYGMMILEMVGGRKNIDVRVSHTSEIYFPNWIYKQFEPGKDFEFRGVITEEEKELAKKMVLVSLWCIQTNPLNRPSMTRVVEMLEGGLEYLKVPPKPSFASQIRSPQHVSPISSSSLSA